MRLHLARVFVVLLAFVALMSCAPLPSVIRDEMAAAPPGVVTIVFFTDFQCPHCRRTHAALAPLLAQHKGKLRVVLRHVPLSRHPDARTAARVSICGEILGARPKDGVDLDHALFEAPDLSERATEQLAVERGVDRDQLRRCLSDSKIDARIERDSAMLDAVNGDGVPLMFVGRTRLDGSQPRSSLEAALESALKDVGSN